MSAFCDGRASEEVRLRDSSEVLVPGCTNRSAWTWPRGILPASQEARVCSVSNPSSIAPLSSRGPPPRARPAERSRRQPRASPPSKPPTAATTRAPTARRSTTRKPRPCSTPSERRISLPPDAASPLASLRFVRPRPGSPSQRNHRWARRGRLTEAGATSSPSPLNFANGGPRRAAGFLTGARAQEEVVVPVRGALIAHPRRRPDVRCFHSGAEAPAYESTRLGHPSRPTSPSSPPRLTGTSPAEALDPTSFPHLRRHPICPARRPAAGRPSCSSIAASTASSPWRRAHGFYHSLGRSGAWGCGRLPANDPDRTAAHFRRKPSSGYACSIRRPSARVVIPRNRRLVTGRAAFLGPFRGRIPLGDIGGNDSANA
jgi:hypothetical protein